MPEQNGALDLSHTPVVPPPPGIVSNFENPENHRSQIYAQHVTLVTAITIAIVMRIYTRLWVLRRRLGLDDYFIILAWMLSSSYSIMFLATIEKGAGRHIWDIPISLVNSMSKFQFINELLYMPTSLATKLSVLLCYLNIFQQSRPTRPFIYFGILVVSLFYFILICATILSCRPIQRAWNALVPDHCRPYRAAAYTSGYFNIFSDVYILVLPLPEIWRLSTSTAKKVKLVMIFGLGVFTCVASIMRLVWTYEHIDDPDVSWSLGKTGYWPALEIDVGIICACAIVFPALFNAENPRSLGSLGAKIRSSLTSRTGKSSMPSSSYKTADRLHEPKGTGKDKSDIDEYDIELLEMEVRGV